MDWLLEGEWFKNCNCDPGCPCDFNQHPTHANCEGLFAMRITKGHVDDVDLAGLCWAGAVWWPGRMDEGNGKLQLMIDELRPQSNAKRSFAPSPKGKVTR